MSDSIFCILLGVYGILDGVFGVFLSKITNNQMELVHLCTEF